ncbi:MAG: hypothetical protein B6I19_10835 [Bacteroidetes bacterium 4572_114]|nr:MAG: hypothetical protein B6I19_10835 [Bacteroidetes bacterium 4572_114]
MKNNRNLIVIMAISLPFILAIFGSCKTSSNSTSKNKQANRMEMCQENNDIITLPEVLPSFPGGETAKKKYLTENIKCPKYTNKQQIQGRIIAAFIVEKDGSLSNITILQGVGGDCDEEVLGIIKKMPRWNPGFCFGEPVRVQYNMAVLFELEKSKNNIPDYLLEPG